MIANDNNIFVRFFISINNGHWTFNGSLNKKKNVIELLEKPLEELLERNIKHKILAGIFKHLSLLY